MTSYIIILIAPICQEVLRKFFDFFGNIPIILRFVHENFAIFFADRTAHEKTTVDIIQAVCYN